jgi:hypothetical protein
MKDEPERPRAKRSWVEILLALVCFAGMVVLPGYGVAHPEAAGWTAILWVLSLLFGFIGPRLLRRQ